MEKRKDWLADKLIAAYSYSMEANKVEELERELIAVDTKLNNVADMLIEKKSDALMKNWMSWNCKIQSLKKNCTRRSLPLRTCLPERI
ncbi:MAG: hypothetical protein J1E98_10360 [Lachnospiraceae bacterium]|nr:hypothetical protein [Lachnospiraceae bacterium]